MYLLMICTFREFFSLEEFKTPDQSRGSFRCSCSMSSQVVQRQPDYHSFGRHLSRMPPEAGAGFNWCNQHLFATLSASIN